jgi:aminopeptidase N
MVTLDSWDHLWLNEGFARFSEAVWYESQGGFEGYHQWILNMYRPSFPGPIVPPQYLFNSTVYLKGAWVLHMLRGVLGDEDFFAALRFYADRHKYANTDTDDFRRACEDATGRRLDWFFDQWVYKKGRPMYVFDWEVEYNDGEPVLDLRIEQLQEQTVFRMPIQMGIEDAEGCYVLVVEDSLRVQHFKLPVRLPPVAVDLDPYDWILSNMIGTDAPEPAEVRLSLGAPWPSPGSPPFRIPVSRLLRNSAIEILDLQGRRLNRIPIAGNEAVLWDGRDARGRDLPSGLYFLRADRSGAGAVRRVWIVR